MTGCNEPALATAAVGVDWAVDLVPVVLVDFFLVAVVAAPFTAVALLLVAAFLVVVAGLCTVFAAFGVGVVVHCHVPFAKIQACPSLAVPYTADCTMSRPRGSRSATCPPLFDNESLVVAEKKAINPRPGSAVPAGKV